MKVKEIIVVEGKCDTNKIKQAVEADTIETNGSAIDKSTLQIIKHAKEKRGVIVFTDPDYAGQRIRSIINEHVPGCKHAFLPKEKALAKRENKSVGIEHATVTDIQHALRHVYAIREEVNHDITQVDLIQFGLIGGSASKNRREQLGEILHIGYTNGKQLLNRLKMFDIKKDELNRAMEHILKESKNGN